MKKIKNGKDLDSTKTQYNYSKNNKNFIIQQIKWFMLSG
jgi:hypothetical protein